MTTSISVHRVKEIRIEKTKLREDSKYEFVEIVVTDDRGQETELNLFGNDHEPISIEATDFAVESLCAAVAGHGLRSGD